MESPNIQERLVHAPLTALMLLEVLRFALPEDARLQSFRYRAINPMMVNQELTFRGAFIDEKKVSVWAIDNDGVAGMTGDVTLY